MITQAIVSKAVVLIAVATSTSNLNVGYAANKAFGDEKYDQAIVLYTQILTSKKLSDGDRETALLNRGISYARTKRLVLAEADLRKALALKSDDIEARNALVFVHGAETALGSDAPPGATPVSDPLAPWGSFAALPGRYWLESTTQANFYAEYEWTRPGVSMILKGRDRLGNAFQAMYFLDDRSGKIIGQSSYKGKTFASEVSVTGNDVLEVGRKDGKATRDTYKFFQDGSFTIIAEEYKKGEWHPITAAKLEPVSQDFINSLGWPAEAAKSESFLHGIGQSLKSGALAGLQQGTADGVHDVVQSRINSVAGTATTQRYCRNPYGVMAICR